MVGNTAYNCVVAVGMPGANEYYWSAAHIQEKGKVLFEPARQVWHKCV